MTIRSRMSKCILLIPRRKVIPNRPPKTEMMKPKVRAEGGDSQLLSGAQEFHESTVVTIPSPTKALDHAQKRRRVIGAKEEEEGPSSDSFGLDAVLAMRPPKFKGRKSSLHSTSGGEGDDCVETKAGFLTSVLKDEDKILLSLRKTLAEVGNKFVSGANFLTSMETKLGCLKKLPEAHDEQVLELQLQAVSKFEEVVKL
ncbi:hypothetical protein DM860_014812 [Cuscuta australis]|uniref:Uncharacterized protein n=1 Tax=Cuscuta australis TaxID=267555 RepID=A0A328D0L2_9ASTE|nr:hypothetical protein DM860_014812 [Cuscuta australis]